MKIAVFPPVEAGDPMQNEVRADCGRAYDLSRAGDHGDGLPHLPWPWKCRCDGPPSGDESGRN
jgi:hypothetical protein